MTYKITPDPDHVARNATRIAEAKEALGTNWITHSANRVVHKDGRQNKASRIRLLKGMP